MLTVHASVNVTVLLWLMGRLSLFFKLQCQN